MGEGETGYGQDRSSRRVLKIALEGMRCVGFEGATSESVSAHGRLDVLDYQHRSSQARGGTKLAQSILSSRSRPHSPSRDRGQWPGVIRIGIGRGSQRGLSQLTRCHRGKQHSRGQAVGQCKRRKRWWQWMLFFVCFLLDRTGSRTTHCRTGVCQLRSRPGHLPN